MSKSTRKGERSGSPSAEDDRKPAGRRALLVEACKFSLQCSTRNTYLFYRSRNHTPHGVTAQQIRTNCQVSSSSHLRSRHAVVPASCHLFHCVIFRALAVGTSYPYIAFHLAPFCYRHVICAVVTASLVLSCFVSARLISPFHSSILLLDLLVTLTTPYQINSANHFNCHLFRYIPLDSLDRALHFC